MPHTLEYLSRAVDNMTSKVIYKCVVCPYTADKRYSMKRHYSGKTFKVPHSDADYEASVLGVTVEEGADDDADAEREMPPDPPVAPPKGPKAPRTKKTDKASASAPVPEVVQPEPEPEEPTSRTARQVVAEIVETPALCAMLLEALALKAASEPVAPFCDESDAVIRAMPDGVKLWRAAVASPSSPDGLVDLLVRKHLRAFRNVRGAADGSEGLVEVSRPGGVWEQIPALEAASEAIKGAASDIRVLHDADAVCGDDAYKRFGSLMILFTAALGAQLGWVDGVPPTPAVFDAVCQSLADRFIAGTTGLVA